MNLKLNSRPRNDRTQYKLLFINKEERDMRKKRWIENDEMEHQPMRRTFVSHHNLGEHFKTEDLTVIYTRV